MSCDVTAVTNIGNSNICGPCPKVFVKVTAKGILVEVRKTYLLLVRLHTNEMKCFTWALLRYCHFHV